MKKFFVCFSLIAAFSPAIQAAAEPPSAPFGVEFKTKSIQRNLIGEVTSIDPANGKMIVQTDAKEAVGVAFGEQTAFRRIAPGQTSLANAETIESADVKVGDRVLVPGYVAGAAQNPVRQIVVMARAAIEQTRTAEIDNRRARTTVGRIVAVNAEKREITVQTRGRGNPETITVALAANARLLRYAPDSLKLGDAVAASFADLKPGDQIRVVGDRAGGEARVNAEEIVTGSVSRTVGTIEEVNAARGEIVVKNTQTGQNAIVVLGKNTTLRRITPEVAATLKERFERRNARRRERNADNSSGQTPSDQTRNREQRRRERSADGQTSNPNRRQLFENLPAIALGELKKGEAVLITGTRSGADAQRMTAVSIVAGDGELQQLLVRAQGGRNNDSNRSTGLPGNVSGGNAASDDDDEP
ncbi:MAG TPA: hypothetical protein VIL74_19100 [Pyrinomonadaceae bacterium]|jgi:sRNA-binding protein